MFKWIIFPNFERTKMSHPYNKEYEFLLKKISVSVSDECFTTTSETFSQFESYSCCRKFNILVCCIKVFEKKRMTSVEITNNLTSSWRWLWCRMEFYGVIVEHINRIVGFGLTTTWLNSFTCSRVFQCRNSKRHGLSKMMLYRIMSEIWL